MSAPQQNSISRRRALPPRGAVAAVAAVFAIVMAGTTLPTPLYPAFEQELGFGNLMTTVIYAVYAMGVLAALVLFGRASDVLGRRPVLLAGLVCAATSAALFLIGGSVGILLAGRVLSGLSAGLFTGTATVALVELATPDRQVRSGVLATVVNMGGLGLGTLLSGVLGAWAPAPLRLSFVVHLILVTGAFALICFLPETVPRRGRRLPGPMRPAVPEQARAAFWPAAVVTFAAFSVFGLLTAIEPAMLSQLLDVTAPIAAGSMVASMFFGSAAGQVLLARVPWRTALPIGCLILIMGLVGVLMALVLTSVAILAVANVVVGTGHGVAFRGAVAAIGEGSPPDRRGESMSMFFIVAYVAISLPVVLTGLATAQWELRAAGIGFTAVVALVAVGAFAGVLRLNR